MQSLNFVKSPIGTTYGLQENGSFVVSTVIRTCFDGCDVSSPVL